MNTLEQRIARIEEYLTATTLTFRPAPEPKYVQVVLDEAVERSGQHVKMYAYEDPTRVGLKVGDRVRVPVGYAGTQKHGTVVRECGAVPPYLGAIKVVAGVL